MVTVYRIGADTPEYTADDRTGAGAQQSGGRWNRRGTPILYTSSSRALACLETLAHLAPNGSFPFNRYLVEYQIPRVAWAARERVESAAQVGWDALPPGIVSLDWGTAWLTAMRSMVAEVPSVVVPEETNVLLNPGHSDFNGVTVQKMRPWRYDHRVRP